MAYVVSALIPCYEMAHSVAAAVDSVLAQHGDAVEVVVVDDGSREDPTAALARFGDRVRLIRQENGGAASARNTAARHATGTWLAFLDADDRWVPGKTVRSLAALAERPRARFVYGQAEGRGDDGSERLLGTPRDGLPMAGSILTTVLVGCNPIPMSTGMVHREAFHAVGGLDESLRSGEDYDLWLRLAERYEAAYVDAPLVRYHMHRGGDVMGDYERWGASVERIHAALLERHPRDDVIASAVAAANADVVYQRGIDRFLDGDIEGARRDLREAARHPSRRAQARRVLRRTFVPGWARQGIRRLLGTGGGS